MVQCIDHQCDVLAHGAVDVVRTAEQFRCLIDQVCCEDSADQSFFVSLVEFSIPFVKSPKVAAA